MEINFSEIKSFENTISLIKNFRSGQFNFINHNKVIYETLKSNGIKLQKTYLLSFYDIDQVEFHICLITDKGQVVYFSNENNFLISDSINNYALGGKAFSELTLSSREIFLFNKEFPGVINDQQILSVIKKTYSLKEFQTLLDYTHRTEKSLITELSVLLPSPHCGH